MNIAKLNTVSLDDKTLIIKRGEVSGETINNQNKVVDITENGTTEVVADGGYTGLGKVTINTEVSGETINNQNKVVNITENGTTEIVADGGYTGLGKVTINTEVSGETINNQNKVVNITENGTTEIVADGGYTGLGKVTINTEVSGGESASTIEYLDVSGGNFVEHPEAKAGFIFVSSAIKIKGDGYLNIIPSAYLITAQDGLEIADVKAFKIDMNEMFLLTNAEPTTTKEELEKSYGKEYLASIPRITKEQFYSLD